ncbi:hypothetical protein BOTBODRAFT_29133 [Botryobasidium botryosum FD-172 SS1]|uniref:GST N-terminal domain-containing protein n=1 Tax=Botryobasidium botryosum (strain FD-172 SS1) TaxID=930990 RepID=A0A067N267_BOTB1|nr:hypothetical protein BOTBODRAFT_29133 [Botryobasidium botryosum FD-172 SS1]
MAATESNPIIFYDITCAPDLPEAQAWSPNTLKARVALNYKRLPYKTIYIPYSEITPTLKSLGLTALEGQTGHKAFTLPIIIDPTPSGPKIVRDSAAIAHYLDATYPDPERTLFPPGSHALQELFYNHFNTQLSLYFISLYLPLVPSILDEESAEYFTRTRSAALGKPLGEVYPKGAELEKMWEEFRGAFGVLDSALQKNEVRHGGVGGDFVMGDKFTFADCVLVAFFIWMNKVEPDRSGWERVKGWHNGRWERLWNKSREFMQEK